MIKYEFPLNERIRRLIRLEHLFSRTQSAVLSSQKYTEYIIFERIFELMQTASRSDLKVDLLQETQRQIVKIKGKTKTKLNQNILIKLKKIKINLEKARIHPGFFFGDDKFLQEIKSRNDTPYGITSVDFPEFQFWLQNQPSQIKKDYITKKLMPFYPIKDAISTILGLIRLNTEISSVIAETGVYQKKLNPHLKLDLITLMINKSLKSIPNISSNKYAISIQFKNAKTHCNTEKDIKFKIGLASL